MRRCTIFLTAFFSCAFAKGQCPVFTYNSVNAISVSATLTPSQKLAFFLNLLQKARAANCTADSVYTGLLHKIAILYYHDGDFVKAINYTRASLQAIEANRQKPSINGADLIKRYYWLSVFYDSLNNYREKIRAADSCLSVSQRWGRLGDIYGLRCLALRIEHDFDVGDYERCVKDAGLCEQLAWKYAASDTAYAEFGKQLALISLGWMVEALVQLKDFKKAEAFLSTKINAYKTEKSRSYEGFLYSELAAIEVQRKAYAKALSLFKQSLAIYKKGGFDFSCKQVLNTVGHDVFFNGINKPEQALFYYKEALRYRNKDGEMRGDDAMETVEILSRVGNVYLRQNRYDSAFAFYQRAFDLIKPGATENDVGLPVEQLASFSKAHVLAALVLSKADAYLQRYKGRKNNPDVREALRLYEIAEKLLVLLRTTQTGLGSKLFWRSNSHRLYENAIEAACFIGDADKAFSFFEKSRAVLLNEQLSQQRFLSSAEIESEVQLQKKILSEEKELATANASLKKYEALQQQLFADRQRLDGLMQHIREKNPLYYQSVLDTSVIRLKDVRRNVLVDHQAVLQLFSGDSAVYALLITASKIFLRKLDKHRFDSLSKKYTEYLSSPSLLNKDFKGYKVVAYQLYRLLFPTTELPEGRIIVSPDGRYFPFESLVVNTGALPVYFLADHAVSYTYSVRYLFNNFSPNSGKSLGDFMGLAPVNFGQSLASLPGSDASLTRLSNYFKDSYNLTSRQASRSNFLRNFSKYNVVQLYSHASSSGSEPVLYFSDSALFLSDLLPESKPAARLIVLSACETAEGQAYLGEGVFSFNRSFAACGIPSSVTNLWSVDDRATYRLTELFYRYISKGLPIDIALQSAKRDFLTTASRREQLPYYWAAAVLVGKTEAVVQPAPSSSTLYFFLCALLCLTAAITSFAVARLRVDFV